MNMNDAHQHLMVNHVSLFCLVIGAIALAVAMKRKSGELRVFASALFVVGGVFAWLAVETGEGAADVVKALGDASLDPFIHQHYEAAEWALRSGLLVATLAIGMEWAARKKAKWLKALQWTTLVFAIHGCTVFATTALLGGHIRHTEVR